MQVFPSLRQLFQREGPVPLGVFVKIPAVEVVELLKLAGVDFVVLDTEHSMLTLRDVNTMIAVAQGLDLPVVVRTPDHGYSDVQRVLDAGSAGVMIPHVNTASEAAAVTTQALHPPRGRRGSGSGMRAGDWGSAGRQEYVRRGADDAVRILMLEEPEGVEAANSICETQGADAVFFGPGDMSLSLGVSPDDDAVRTAMERVARVAAAHCVPAGTVASTGAAARRCLDLGYNFLMVGNDTGMLKSAARRQVDKIREMS